MANECELKHYDKVFGNCEVCWKIEDFCLATCKENYWIQSSEFCVTGPKSTTWKLIFIPKQPKSSSMRLYLERQNDPGPKYVFVNWSLTVGSLNENFYYSEYNNAFEKLTKKGTDVYNVSDVLSSFKPFDCDTLIIRCHFIIKHPNRIIDERKTSGLTCLSDDLALMYKSVKDKDLTLKVGKTQISVHKVILSRNAVLQKLSHSTDIKILEFPNLNPAAVTKYIDFLYSGNFHKILSNPSISMHKCIEVLDRDLLKCYFALEKLKLHTQIEIEEFQHMWIIQNFSVLEEECLTSPPFKNTNLDTTWQLRIYRHGNVNIDYLSVFADIVEGNKPSNVCLEFAVEDSKGEIYYPSKIPSSNGNYDLGIVEFLYKDHLDRTTLVVDDTLKLVFRVRTWNGEYCSTIGSRMIPFITETEESSYERLSKTMLNVYQLRINTDILIQAENDFFGAHKCILSARSPILLSMINDLKGKTILTLNDITPRVLDLLLVYIYSGVLVKLDRETLITLREVAQRYRISCLEEDCQQLLRQIVVSHTCRLS